MPSSSRPPHRGQAANTDGQSARSRQRGRPGGTLLLAAVVLTAVNLRTAVTSVGPLLAEIRGGVDMSGPVAGLLTSVPVLCFAVVGSLAPAVTRRVGPHRTLAVAMALMAAGVLLRSGADDAPTFLACSVLALVGGAAGNVLLPVLVKLHFPDRIGLLTAVYTTVLAVGATTAAALAVPVATLATSIGRAGGSDVAGAGDAVGWRYGLGVWAVPAAAAVLAWLLVLRLRLAPAADGGQGPDVARSPARTRLGWALALYFGAQALQVFVAIGWFAQFFREAGASAATAGYLLAFLTALSVPVSMVIPAVAARLRSQRPVVLGLALCYLTAYVGMLLAPLAGAWVWALLAGAGAGTFPLALTLIGLRSATARETASLSAFTQSAGYLLAAAGPLLVGWLHGRGGWAGPFAVLFVALAVQVAAGLVAGGPTPARSSAAGRRAGAA